MTTEQPAEVEQAREALSAFCARLGITAEAQRITREGFRAAAPGAELGEIDQPDRTYWMVTLRRGRIGIDIPYSCGTSAWWETRGAFGHRREGDGFVARCSSCFTSWPCDDAIAASLRADVGPEALPAAPTLEDVLDSILSDAIGYEDARDFADWCGEYGYDTDSRKAERTYHAIAEQTRQARRLIGSDEWTAFLNCEGL